MIRRLVVLVCIVATLLVGSALPLAAPAVAAQPAPERALARGKAPERLWAVMIDNHPRAYPQFGLDASVMVFEALAEFGITRYMAIYAPGISPDIKVIGPVRSARPYYVEWARGLQTVYVHAGGSPEGLQMAASSKEIADVDALVRNKAGYFWRSTQRSAPHNLFTSSANLRKFVVDAKVQSFEASELGFLFKSDAAEAERPASQSVSYFFIYPEESAGWSYDKASNGYYRLRRGKAHVDGTTGKQLWFKNVVLMEVFEAPIKGDTKGRIEQQVIGEGKAVVLVDGRAIEATWRKPSAAGSLRFYDAAGNELMLNAGPVWMAAVPKLSNVVIKGGL